MIIMMMAMTLKVLKAKNADSYDVAEKSYFIDMLY
jgi:hypothetical protein